MANDMIRMSGMNSGLDTESIINALTANTKLKATKQERNVLKYEATQEAYRDIISKMQNIKNKYFDILNKDSYLAGSSMWNKYATKVYDSGNLETLASGISVTTNVNTNAGDYKVTVNKTAKQAKLTGNSLSGNAKVDFSSLEEGKEYGITLTVGDAVKTVKFTAGGSDNESRDNLNEQLEKAFGESNDSVGDGVSPDKKYLGMVYVDNGGKLVSRSGKGISMSGVGQMKDSNVLDLSNVKSGSNTVSFQVGDQSVSTSFQTIESDYFDDIISLGMVNTTTGEYQPCDDTAIQNRAKALAREELGADASDDDVQMKSYEYMVKFSEAQHLYKEVADDYKESVRYEAFKTWKESASETDINNLYTKALADHKDNQISKWIAADEDMNNAYKAYQDSYANSVLSAETKSLYNSYAADAGTDAKGIYEWATEHSLSTQEELEAAENNPSTPLKSAYQYIKTQSAFSAKLTKLDHKYEGTGNGETDYDSAYYADGYKAYQNSYATEHLSDTSKAAYEEYKAGLGENDTVKGIYEWAQGNSTARSELTAAQSEDPLKSQTEWKKDKIERDSWRLDKDIWKSSESNLFSQYKKSVYNESRATYDLSKENIIDHFNESALKNIESLELDDGTKFEVDYNKTTNKATITAYKETTDADGNTVRTNMAAAITVGKNSANNAETLGNAGADATTSISQITNSTKLGDIGATADENGNYSFKINGVSFSFDGDTTVTDMMKKVNASSAGVKMTYSSLDNAFTITSSRYGVSAAIDAEDTSGGSLLSSLGITGGTFSAGENLEVEINGQIYQSDTNSIEVDGSTFTISSNAKTGEEFTVSIGKDTSAIKDLIKEFVNDYNKLIEDVYKYLDEKPEKDYYFLTDADKEDLELTEKQEEKWEAKAKMGLLYHDSITSSVMTGLRTALMGSVEGFDGNGFALAQLGIKTASDYNQHGKLVLSESDLETAISDHFDDLQKLFSDSEDGIMKKFSAALDAGIGTTGKEKGSLIRKAGLATGSTATDNEIYNAIKRTKTRITSLNTRYENEQNRLWKKYSAMESMLGTLNNQQASFSSYFMQQ